MGRRAVPLSEQARWVFNRVARDYAARPPYPGALADRVAALAGGPGARAADLGAGTGLLAFPLAARGLCVSAVDPAAGMLAVADARRAAEDAPVAARVRLVHATAEATGLAAGAFDLVLLADAVQWVDPERAGREAARLVRAGGVVAVVEAAFAATPFMDALAALLAAANPKARPRPPGRARQLLSVAGGPGAGSPQEERFRHEVSLDDAAVEPWLRSMSHVGPALGPGSFRALAAGVRAAAARTGGARVVRDLTLRWVAARPRRA